MEVWTVEEFGEGKYRWNKKKLAAFPLPDPDNLTHYLLQYWMEHDEQYWVVFSDEEKAEIEKLGAPFIGAPADGILRRFVEGPLRDARQGYVSVTYEPADTPDFKLHDGQKLQLCINFNRRI